ncbi:MAG: hypothetical protein LBF04_00285, partial [Prevotellaceae bacterium]|jgi:hypothetical protein|nr:hypothetical protein [Prevotellaceae bacterium]
MWLFSGMFLFGCKSRQEHSFYEPSQNTVISTSDYDTLSSEEINLLQNGDIIMRQGRGIISLAISAQLNEKYRLSHCGILNIVGDTINVIHTLSLSVSSTNGMQQATLYEFIGDTYKNSIIVVRLKNSDSNKIANKAKYYLSKKIPFDDHFDFADTTKFFCNELITHIIAVESNVNLIDTTADEMHNLQFGRFTDTAKFDIIINHQNIDN